MVASFQQIRLLVSYLEEKKSMGILWRLSVSAMDTGMWRPGCYQKIRVSFHTPPVMYARILLVELQAQQMYFACSQFWTAFPIVSGPHKGSHAPVRFSDRLQGEYALYRPVMDRESELDISAVHVSWDFSTNEPYTDVQRRRAAGGLV